MVYFVGAGPGAPDLITVRGQRLLEQADVIIYAGSLVNPALLQTAKPSCEVYNSAYMTLEEVISVMEAAAQAGKSCVRLHTGDPSFYGAVREQMDELDKREIPYESCPGVSAMFGAAAAMNLEYTLPGVSQTVIISRTAGRTPVPEREEIRKLAAHQSTMVLYLSAGKMEKLQAELLAGGYAPGTPAAIVYKATWPEEKRFRCTVRTLAETAQANGITKTALVIVGNVLGENYERSRLYDPSFSTGFRDTAAGTGERYASSENRDCAAVTENVEKERKRAALIAFTQQGTGFAIRMAKLLVKEGWSCEVFTTQKSSAADGANAQQDTSSVAGAPDDVQVQALQEPMRGWTGKRFADSSAILFVGAAGIAVRSIAPFVKDKMTDPAVLVIDEAAKHVIPLLSGHLGGANRLAQQLSEYLGADCVLTTATDVRHRFAVDCFALDNGLFITDREKAKAISAAILDGETVGICAPEGWLREAEFPAQLERNDNPAQGSLCVRIDWRSAAAEETALRLVPEKSVWIGAGCKKGISKEALKKAFEDFLRVQNIDRHAVAGIASISLKREEQGLLDFAAEQRLPQRFYNAEQLEALGGAFSDSAFVRQQTGTGNVCERAAFLAAQENWYEESDSLPEQEMSGSRRTGQSPDFHLIVKKQIYEGITFAAALTNRRLHFE